MSHSNQEENPTDDIAEQSATEESQDSEPLSTEIDRTTGLLPTFALLGLVCGIGLHLYIKRHA